jgi:TrmH family RNA methyltransferase
MGTIERMQWRRAELSELDCAKGVFALEVGGIPLDKFSFPFPGLMVVGSEELGVSNKALQYCSAGFVGIPLVGTKASLNVATAFGIAGYSWYYSRNLQA